MLKRTLMAVAAVLALAGCTSTAEPHLPASASSETPAASATPTPTPTPTPVVSTLSVGDCTGPVTPGSTDVTTTACSSAHYWEVFALVPLNTQVFPDGDLLASTAKEGCLAAFTKYVGVEPSFSRYSAVYLVPDQAAWQDPGQRRIVCLAGSQQGGLKGSAKGDDALFPEVGECTGPQDVPVLEVAVIDCDSKHDYEVYADKQIKTKKAPSDSELQKLLKDVCIAEFEDFVGVPVSKSKYEYSYFIAGSDVWKKVADHRLVCSVGSPKGGIEGSLKGVEK